MDTTDMPESFNNRTLAELPIDKLYEVFSQQAWDLPEVVVSFDALKEKLGLKSEGLELYQQLKVTLGAQNSKAWKARDVLNQLEKRANQKEYMHQVGWSVCVCVCMHSYSVCVCVCVCVCVWIHI